MRLTNTVKLLFAGERVEDIVTLIMHYLAGDKKILVVDMTSEKKIIINTTGLIENSTCSWKRIQYTTNYQYYEKNAENFDAVLIGTELLTDMETESIMKEVDAIYILSGLGRYSIFTLIHNINKLDTMAFGEYFFVFRAEKQEIVKQDLEIFWKSLGKNRKEPRQCYYIPNNILDYQALNVVGYEDIDRIKISKPMQQLIGDINVRLHQGEAKNICNAIV